VAEAEVVAAANVAPVLVSVVVPVYDGAGFLADCLDGLMAQDHPALEIVCVDDGSRDDSAGIASGYESVHVLRRAHAGLAAARNAGVAAVTGPLVGFCDADDVWKPEKVSTQVAYLGDRPDVDIALCRNDTALEPGAEYPSWVIPDQVRGDLDGVSPTSGLFRREVFERVLYRDDLGNGSDFNLLVRAREAGFSIAVMDDVLFVRRIHDDNMTTREGAALAPMFKTVREHLRGQTR
jgi:glycosyltransferase involved in cell wall biosynthesis